MLTRVGKIKGSVYIKKKTGSNVNCLPYTAVLITDGSSLV